MHVVCICITNSASNSILSPHGEDACLTLERKKELV